MRADIVLAALEAHRVLPLFAVRRLLGLALDGARVALCLHRVRMSPEKRKSGPDDGLTIDAKELDALLDLILAAQIEDRGEWALTASFDDGYRDAADYVASRHDRYPTVKWLFFVCPEKAKKRAGFRWDAAARAGDDGNAILNAPLDVATENDRAELRGLADDPDFRLLTVEECRTLRKLPNVELGNHTNTHFKQVALSLEDSRKDLTASRRDFEDLFGPTEHFAFPFGTPRSEVLPEHAAIARELGYSRVWSTEPRPYDIDERQGPRMLPRYPVVGTWPVGKIALYMSVRAMRWRLRRANTG